MYDISWYIYSSSWNCITQSIRIKFRSYHLSSDYTVGYPKKLRDKRRRCISLKTSSGHPSRSGTRRCECCKTKPTKVSQSCGSCAVFQPAQKNSRNGSFGRSFGWLKGGYFMKLWDSDHWNDHIGAFSDWRPRDWCFFFWWLQLLWKLSVAILLM